MMLKIMILNHLIDPTFSKVNRLFVLSFENKNDRTSFSKHYTPKVEIRLQCINLWQRFF